MPVPRNGSNVRTMRTRFPPRGIPGFGSPVGQLISGLTEMVRDMRGMGGKLHGLVDICIGWLPKSEDGLAGEAFAADGAHRQELLQDGGLGCQRAAHLTRRAGHLWLSCGRALTS
jgi:hypothetical protein